MEDINMEENMVEGELEDLKELHQENLDDGLSFYESGELMLETWSDGMSNHLSSKKRDVAVEELLYLVENDFS